MRDGRSTLRSCGGGKRLALFVAFGLAALMLFASVADARVVRGTAKSNTLRGTASADTIAGLGGRDSLYGAGGRDRLSGGRGGDLLVGGKRADRLAGGAGNDAVLARGGGADSVACGAGLDTALVDASDTVAASCEVVRGVGSSAAAAAADLTAGPLVQVSGTSPFADCTADNIAAQSGTNYLNSEVEPWLDVNPEDESNLFASWQQDRWSNGGSRGLVGAASFDGGLTWSDPMPIPGTTLCSGGEFERATDPWHSFGPNGDLYLISLNFNDSNFVHSLTVSESHDGGLTWEAPQEIIRDVAPTVFNDKQSITADPTDPDYVYAVWDRLVFPNEKANVQAAFHAAAFRGPALFARSTDGGETWERSAVIFEPGQHNQTIGNQIFVLPNGDLVDLFNMLIASNRHGLRGGNVAILRSTDKGETWSDVTVIDKLGAIGVTDPETGDPVRTGDIIPDGAVDMTTGNMYVVWQDARFTGVDGVAFSMSTDGGLTWSEAIKVNQTPTDIPLGNQQAFTPSVEVAADGTIGITYYDFRNNTSVDPLLTDYFLATCNPASTDCSDSANWTETKLTDTSFDMRQAPFAGGFFTGDYEGLASAGDDFLTLWSMPHD
ncbi:MAG: exo-alpha-sialidase, partial [Actinomycetota bacterium]|nr:exo-alpha-sialidase [Actinomycetota bacterium]